MVKIKLRAKPKQFNLDLNYNDCHITKYEKRKPTTDSRPSTVYSRDATPMSSKSRMEGIRMASASGDLELLPKR